MSFQNKSISESDYDKIVSDSSTDEAIPELRFKYDMFKLLNDFTVKFSNFQNVFMINKFQDTNLRADAITAMLAVFNQIKYMVYQKSGWNINYSNVFIYKDKSKTARSLDQMRKDFKVLTDFNRLEM